MVSPSEYLRLATWYSSSKRWWYKEKWRDWKPMSGLCRWFYFRSCAFPEVGIASTDTIVRHADHWSWVTFCFLPAKDQHLHAILYLLLLQGSDEENNSLLKLINGSKQLFLVATTFHSQVVLRLAAGSILADQDAVDRAWQVISVCAEQLANTKPECCD